MRVSVVVRRLAVTLRRSVSFLPLSRRTLARDFFAIRTTTRAVPARRRVFRPAPSFLPLWLSVAVTLQAAAHLNRKERPS